MSMSVEQSEHHNLRVLVAARHFSAIGVERSLRRGGDLRIVDVVRSDQALRERVDQSEPDVVLIDLELPTSGGLAAAVQLIRTDSSLKVIVTASEHRMDLLRKVVRAGLHGYLVAPVEAGFLTQAIRCVVAGGAVFPHALVSGVTGLRSDEERQAMLRAQSLTRRERELLVLLVEGFRGSEIAERLFVSRHTVRTHLYNMFAKLQVHSREEAIQFAVRNEIVELSGDDQDI